MKKLRPPHRASARTESPNYVKYIPGAKCEVSRLQTFAPSELGISELDGGEANPPLRVRVRQSSTGGRYRFHPPTVACKRLARGGGRDTGGGQHHKRQGQRGFQHLPID